MLFIFAVTTAAYAAPQVILDGQALSFDVPPVIENGTTLVPLRVIFEALGADVQWDEANQTVTAFKSGTEIRLVVGGQAYKNGNEVQLLVPAKIIEGRTMIPLRFVSEALNCWVNWDSKTQTITIKTPQKTKLSPVPNNNPVLDSFKTPNGDYYKGYAINGVPNGHGVMTCKDGMIVECDFVNGLPPLNGIVKITFPDRSTYEGDVSNGKLTGQARLTYADGFTYNGGVINLSFNGYGEAVYPDGSIYKGYWKDGLWDGIGTVYSNGRSWNTLYANGVNITPTYSTDQVSPKANPLISNGSLFLIADDGENTYLGKLTTNEFDSDSIYNDFGTYGNKFSSKSIWNEFGTYGNPFSSLSPFNEFTSTPPIIVDADGNTVGRLTVNSLIPGAINPNLLYKYLKDLGL